MGRPVRIALIGAGTFVRKAHAPSLLELGDAAQIVAVYSRTRASAETVADAIPYDVDIYTDIAALLANEGVEAVDIVLPIPMLPEVVSQALAAGKHVFSEKPIAQTVAEAQDLIARSRPYANQVWMVGENWRYEEAFHTAAQAIAAGRIGQPLFCDLSLQLQVQADSLHVQTTWRNSGEVLGGYLLDGGVHHIAGLRVLLGEIESVCALTAAHRAYLPPADTMSAALRFASGVVGTYLITYAVGSTLGTDAVHIGGTEGSLRVSRGELVLNRGEESERQEFNVLISVREELAAFLAAVRDGAPHRNSPQEALQDLAVVEAMLASAQAGTLQRVERHV
ncbi:MAG: Gfo/Idh/MocA family oxidoreductase [Caldilineaceae bacterium]|nr:Gfo/Idh/MocA family oxidoreductase [Caldilineaceae bacterium]